MQRADQRFEVSIKVDCASRGMFVAHRVTNISRGGLFIEGKSLPLDTEVTLHLHLEGSADPILTRARVVWNYDMQKGTAHLIRGTGLRFLDMAPEELMRLSAYLASLPGARPLASPA